MGRWLDPILVALQARARRDGHQAPEPARWLTVHALQLERSLAFDRSTQEATVHRREIIPGLVVTGEMRDVAAHALATYIPGYRLSWEEFTVPDRWWLLPDPEGRPFRAEYVIREDHDATVKVNLWLAPDLRAGQTPWPHSHPCAFTSYILLGGYTETRYEVDADGGVRAQTVTHRQGGQNSMPRHVFHEVGDVEPEPTVTLIVGGEGERGGWGYLDPKSGAVTRTQPDPGFNQFLRLLNPHRMQGPR